MTDTATLPAGITQLPEPCWELPNDDLTHYPNERTALDAAEEDEERHGETKPTQMKGRCWVAQTACGRWVDTDGFHIGHHATSDEARAAAHDQDFTVYDGVLRCEDGDPCEAKTEESK